MNKFFLILLLLSVMLNAGLGWFSKNQLEKNIKQKQEVTRLESQIKKERELQGAIDTARREYLQALNDEKNKNDNLRNINKRLHIGAECPELPGATAGTGAGKAELNENTRRAVFDFRDRIIKTESLLELCIKTIKAGNNNGAN